jgi:hypothetical protein
MRKSVSKIKILPYELVQGAAFEKQFQISIESFLSLGFILVAYDDLSRLCKRFSFII